MKLHLIRILIMFFTVPVLSFSQPDSSKIFLGINGVGIYHNDGNSNYFDLVMSPKIGYCATRNFMIGASVDYGHSRSYYELYNYASSDNRNSVDKTNAIMIGPLMRYYFHIKKMAIFLEANASVGREKSIGKYSDRDDYHVTLTNLRNIGLGLGYAYFINQNIGIEINPIYVFTKYSSKSGYVKSANSKPKGDFSGGKENEGILIQIGINVYL